MARYGYAITATRLYLCTVARIPSPGTNERTRWDAFCKWAGLGRTLLLRRGFRLIVETLTQYPDSELAKELRKPSGQSRYDRNIVDVDDL